MSKTIEDGGPAFPLPDGTEVIRDYQPGNGDFTRTVRAARGGMSLRDWFAGMAMVGYLTDTKNPDNASPDKVAEWSYQNADAMLSARKEQR